jgi:Pumilio-family RNA binding repeat
MAENKADYNRPRRPAPDTISYLRSLPLDLEQAHSEIQSFRSSSSSSAAAVAVTVTTNDQHQDAWTNDFPPTLAAALSALYEIRLEIASLSGDEHAACVVELLCRIALPVSVSVGAMVLSAIVPYALHLSTHRYGSHVLQTILELTSSLATCAAANTEDLARHAEAPVPPSSSLDATTTAPLSFLHEQMLQIALDLLEYNPTDLAQHICGSHVLRTILCWLGDVSQRSSAVVASNRSATRRGATKPKKRKRNTATTDAGHHDQLLSHHADYYLYYPSLSLELVGNQDLPERKRQTLERFTTALTVSGSSTGPGEVQKWACHSSAGPVLTLLLQIWTYLDKDTAPRQDWIQRHEQWSAQQSSPNRHLGLARPEPKFSVDSTAHDIVRRILCWTTQQDKDSDELASRVLYGLAGEARGSRVLETILRHSPDDVYAKLLELGTFLDPTTIQDYIQDGPPPVDNELDANAASGSCSNFVIQTVLQTARNPQQAQSLLMAMKPSMPYLLDPHHKRRGLLWRMAEMAAFFPECQETLLSMISAGMSTLLHPKSSSLETPVVKLNKCIPHLLNMRAPARDGERWILDVAGTRAVYHLLQFQPSRCKDTIKGLLELSVEHIEGLAKDGLGSRCILDALLDGPKDESMFVQARQRLLGKLTGRWVALAVDRVGHHTVQKLFDVLRDIKDQERLVQELLVGKSRLLGNSMGRTVLDALQVRVYEAQGEAEWAKSIKSNQKKKEWLNEIIDSEGKEKETRATRIAAVPRSAKSSSGLITASVESIMNAIVMPNPTKRRKNTK